MWIPLLYSIFALRISWIDIAKRIIPEGDLALFALVTLHINHHPWGRVPWALLILVVGIPLKNIGYGDVKLTALLLLWIPPSDIPSALTLAVLLALPEALVRHVLARIGKNKLDVEVSPVRPSLAFAPYLFAGFGLIRFLII
jgi:prepilin signal peptidase PulO-like enzyme (type II secretory pathway)